MGFGAFNTALTGLRSHSTMLQVIGDNIANLNTPGFKRSRAHFSNLMEIEMSCGAVRVGGGVRVDSVDRVFSQGPLVQTSRPLDLALQGNGFFSVDVNGREHYTRDGAFDFDKEGTLRHISSGGEVLGSNGQAITAPMSQVSPSEVTSQVDVIGNFDASASGPVNQILSSRAPLESAPGVPATSNTSLNELTANTTNYENGDTIVISGRDTDGSSMSSTFIFGNDNALNNGTTLGDLVNFINGTGTGPNNTTDKFPNASLSLSANGNLVLSSDTPGDTDLTLNFENGLTKSDGTPQTGATNFRLHTLEESIAGADPSKFSSTIEIFDKDGESRQLNLAFTKNADQTWNITADVAGANMVDSKVNNIRFNKDGSFSGVAGTGDGDGNISYQVGNCPPVSIDLSFGPSGGFQGATQFGGFSDATAKDQNGSPFGSFDAAEFDEDGNMVISFTNGKTESRGQLRVVNFQNPGGLRSAGRNLFQQTSDSGNPMEGALQSGSTRVLAHYMENSNVDQAQELTNMIIAQNGFAANSRTISASQQLFDTTLSLVR